MNLSVCQHIFYKTPPIDDITN